MSKQISPFIEKHFKFLKLTKAGKLYLSAFPYKVLSRAKNMFLHDTNKNMDAPFSVFVAMCIYKAGAKDIEERIDTGYWDYIDNIYDNQDPDMTFVGEKKCDDTIKLELNMIRKNRRAAYSSDNPHKNKKQYSSFSKNSGPIFNKGVKYWKRGKWYPYPDEAFNNNSKPAQPDPDWEPAIPADDPKRDNVDPVEELKKAIKTGKVNKTGLRFLRDTFIHSKPELMIVIDTYLNS